MYLELIFFLIVALIIYKLPINSVVLALLSGIILAQFISIDSSNDSVFIIQNYLLIFSIALFLISSNYKVLFSRYFKLVQIFLISVVGSLIGYVICLLIFNADAISLVSLSTYIGGSVNLLSSSKLLNLSSSQVSQIIVVDSVLTAFYLLFLTFISPKATKVSINIKHNDIFKQVIKLGSYLVAIFAILILINMYLSSSTYFYSLFLNKYTIIILVCLILVNVFTKYFKNITINYVVGEIFLIMFFLTIGIDAKLYSIFNKDIIDVIFICLIIICSNVVFTLISGKLLKFSIVSSLTASNAAIGGPSTSFSYAQNYNTELAVGSLIIGSQGYVLSFIIVNLLTI